MEIESYLQDVQSATIEELQKKFKVSVQTLRRDLKELEDKRIISKVYGGVIYNGDKLLNNSSVIDFQIRSTDHLLEKQNIGKIASSLVQENDVIFIDSGTTTCQVLPFLEPFKNLTVVTHSLLAMEMLQDLQNVHTILLGGEYRNKVKSFQFDMHQIHYFFSKAFIATVGISLQQGLTNIDLVEGEVKKEVIRRSKLVYLMCDSSKFDYVAYNRFADLNQINGLITETKPSDKYMNYLNQKSIRVFCSSGKL